MNNICFFIILHVYMCIFKQLVFNTRIKLTMTVGDAIVTCNTGAVAGA